MPCESVITIACDLGKVDAAALNETLKTLGFNGTLESFSGVFEGATFWASLDRATGKLSVTSQYVDTERLTAALKKGHTRQIVLRQAKRAGWQVRETKAGKMQLIRR